MEYFILFGIGGDIVIASFDGITFAYPVEKWVEQQHQKHLRLKKEFSQPDGINSFMWWFVEGVILSGRNRFGETEQEWWQLWNHFIDLRDNRGEPFPYIELLILLDVSLLLEHEGNPIPNLLK